MPSEKFRDEPMFPPVTFRHGRGYLGRAPLEWFKAATLAHTQGLKPPPPPASWPEGDPQVPLSAAAAELGVHRRTIARYIKRSQEAHAPPGDDPVAQIREICQEPALSGAQLNRLKALALRIGKPAAAAAE